MPTKQHIVGPITVQVCWECKFKQQQWNQERCFHPDLLPFARTLDHDTTPGWCPVLAEQAKEEVVNAI